MREVNYYVATSVDGFIAQPDGSFDGFLPEGPHVEDYVQSLAAFDTVLMGRKTYEIGLREGKTDPYPTMESYVFSRTLERSPDKRVRLVSADAPGAVRRLRERYGKEIYLCGGAELARLLFAARLIDLITLKVNPFLMGDGIRLFSDVIRQTPLELVGSTVYSNGVLVNRYRVGHVNRKG